MRALPRHPGQTSGKASAESTRTAMSVPSGWWTTRPRGCTVRARPGAAAWMCSGSRGAQRRTGRARPPSSVPATAGVTSSAARESSPSGATRRAGAPTEARVPSSARRNADNAVSVAGPGPPPSAAQTNTRASRSVYGGPSACRARHPAGRSSAIRRFAIAACTPPAAARGAAQVASAAPKRGLVQCRTCTVARSGAESASTPASAASVSASRPTKGATSRTKPVLATLT